MKMAELEGMAHSIALTIRKALDGPLCAGRIAELEARIARLEMRPLQKWAGTHVTGMQASLVTRGGSLWVATAPTTTTPGDAGADWRLIVKRGHCDARTVAD